MADDPGSVAVSASSVLRKRDGSNPIERKAVYRALLEIRSMPASLVVQIALWPDKLADWAKESGIAPAVVYNMLAGVKPYHRVRTLLARRLDVPKAVLDHLVDAPRPEPLSRIPPDPPQDFPLVDISQLRPEPQHPPTPAAPGEGRRAGSAAANPPPSRPRRVRSHAGASAAQTSLNI